MRLSILSLVMDEMWLLRLRLMLWRRLLLWRLWLLRLLSYDGLLARYALRVVDNMLYRHL